MRNKNPLGILSPPLKLDFAFEETFRLFHLEEDFVIIAGGAIAIA